MILTSIYQMQNFSTELVGNLFTLQTGIIIQNINVLVKPVLESILKYHHLHLKKNVLETKVNLGLRLKLLKISTWKKNFLSEEIENESKDTVQIGLFTQQIAEHLIPSGTTALGEKIALQGRVCHCCSKAVSLAMKHTW